MAFNNVPANGWPQLKQLQELEALAEKIDNMPTYTSDDRDFLDTWETALPISDEVDPGQYVFTATKSELGATYSWEEPETGAIDFSTTEQDTGIKWVDSKTIYQKTFAFDNSSNAQISIDVSTLNIDRVIDGMISTGQSALGYNQLCGTYYLGASDYLTWHYNTENGASEIKILRGADWFKTANGYITIRYTKATT